MTTAVRGDRQQITEPSPPRRGGLRWAVIAFVVVLLLAEVGARLLAQFVPPRDGWNVPALGAQVEALRAAEDPPEVLVLGTSVVGAGIDPDTVAAASDRYDSAFNLWSVGAPVRSLQVMYDDIAQPLVSPEVVVIGLTSRELNSRGSGQDRQYQSLISSLELQQMRGTESVGQRLERFAGRFSAFIKLRPLLRDPGRLLLDLQAGGGQRAERTPWESTKPFELRPGHLAQERDALRGFTADGQEFDALRRLIADVREDGAQVLLVNMPVDEAYAQLHPDGAADQAAFNSAFDELCQQADLDCLDVQQEQWSRQYFSNENHLNAQGADRLARLVAQELDAP